MARSRFPTTGDLAAVFVEIPPNIRRYIVEGFKTMARLDTSAMDDLVSFALSTLSDIPTDRELEDLAKKLGITSKDAPSVLSAVSFVINAISERSESGDEFVSEACKAGVLESADTKNVKRVTELALANREAIKNQIAQEQLASDVLPSLAYFESAIDLRMSFEDRSHIAQVTPVAVVHIDTDAVDQEIWFQMSLTQAERMVKELEVTCDRLRAAASF